MDIYCISVTSEIARLENVNGERCHDLELAKKVAAMSKITLASSAEVWIINLPGDAFNHFYSNDMEGLGLTGIQEIFLTSYENMKNEARIIIEDTDETMESFPVTRSAKRAHNQLQVAHESDEPRNQLQVAQESDRSSAMAQSQIPEPQGMSAIHTPAGETIVSGDRLTEEHGMSSVAPLHENGTIRWTNVPRQPIPPLDDINLWIGHQLYHK